MPNTVTAALTILKKADIETMSAGRGLPNNQNAPALPAWPLLTLLYGFPIIWALGLLQIAPIILAFVMLGYMLVRGSVRIYPALWVWGALTFWVVVCAVSLVEPTDLIAWGFRFGCFLRGCFYALLLQCARRDHSGSFAGRVGDPLGHSCAPRLGWGAFS